MTFHSPYYYDHSPNVRLIMNTSRVELLKFCRESGKTSFAEFPHQIAEVVAALTAFAAARPYFAAEIATLQAYAQDRALTTDSLLPILTSLTSKLVY